MKHSLLAMSSFIVFAGLSSCSSTLIPDNARASSLFQAPWNSGQSADEPEFHAQKINENTVVIRQSLRTSFESPFLYLLFGEKRALLIDTGVEGVDLRAEIDRHMAARAVQHDGNEPELIVMHSHGHRDHKGGDTQLADRPNTQIVGLEADEIESFFSIEDWPNTVGSIDLGGRTLEVVPTPGHTDSHVMVFDPATQILFSGDTVYPGRLYYKCEKASTYEASINRVADYVTRKNVKWLLGAHIEMTSKPGQPFAQDNTARHNEHLLELPASIIGEIKTALADQAGQYTVEAYDAFVLLPHPADPTGKSPPNWCLSSEQ